jgi:sugar diacid utilization regulator
VLAVAASSSAEEEKLLEVKGGVETAELRVADAVVGELRIRPRGKDALPAATVRMVATLLGLEVERARAPEWASDEAAHDFVEAVLERRITDPDDIAARASELGTDLSAGAGVVYLRAHPQAAQPGAWRERVLMLTLRAVRAGGTGAVAYASHNDAGEAGEVAAIVPTPDPEAVARAAGEVAEELASALAGFEVTVGYSRHAATPAELYRAGKEALLAVNVGEAEGSSPLAFEETGSYRLLLPAMSEDPGELERFFDETVAPLAAYDQQYETELVVTVEAYLENDGNVTPTAETLFTHRHTVRYRLERVKELCGHDLSSTEGREKLGLGLKAMRVLGIPAPSGPAMESRKRRREGD